MTGHEVCIQDDRVACVRPATGAVDLPGRMLMPGLVNAHSHAFQRGLRGHVQWTSGQHDDFWSWREKMYSLAKNLDPDGIEAVSALAFLEMALAGFTAVGEFHYLHHSPDGRAYTDPDELARRVIKAARSVGIRIALLRVSYGRGGEKRFRDRDAESALLATSRLRKIDDPAVTIGLAPHSVRAVPKDWLKEFADFDGPIHAHVSEQPRENAECLNEHGMSPTALFQECGLLDQRFTAVHMTWPQLPDDGKRLKEAGARVCACPTTELDLGDGFLPIDHLADVPLCIGSDSHALIDPFVELRSLEWHARACQGRRNVLTPPGARDALAHRLLEIGSAEGRRALAIEDDVADFVALDLNDVRMAGAQPLTAAVWGAARVTDVWVGGRQIVQGGAHPGTRAIVDRANAVLNELR
jgi:formimidoylglutamate deiminase